MRYTLTKSEVTITCTMEELGHMESLGLTIYATPNPQGETVELYLASRPKCRYDFLLADIQDFLDAEGWHHTGWAEMDADAQDACADDEHNITVPRTKQGREAAA